MRLIDYSHQDPALNLAHDEALLDDAEAGCTGDTLRFWESPVPFVVLGTGQVLAEQVREATCKEDGVPILRRCSAGGCVLQGPGSLNFALIFRLEENPEVRGLHGSYEYILHRVAQAFQRRGIAASHSGICDLTIAGRKVSGNAQRRRRRAILHHGTLLHAPNAEGMVRYLHEPAERPAYRGTLTHDQFVGCTPFGPDMLRRIVAEAFNARIEGTSLTPWELESAEKLAVEKYRDPAWTYRK